MTTTKTLLEQINDGLRGKITYWVDKETVYFGHIVLIEKSGFVVVDRSTLPNELKPKQKLPDIVTIELDKAMLGVYEIASLN